MTEITRDQVIEAIAKAIEKAGEDSQFENAWHEYAATALSAIEALGFKLVPYDPDETMLQRVSWLGGPSAQEVYQKMLSSSPLYREEEK